MAIQIISDWNGKELEAVRTRSGVWAFPDVTRNLLRGDATCWPPIEIVQKLCASDRVRYFSPEDQPLLTRQLGYYSDLQSAHSEDAIQWSYFGTASWASAEMRVQLFNSMLRHLGLPSSNTTCSISIWRRVPHPESLSQNGPELDFLIVGDETVVIGESKWRSGESHWQGVNGTSTQVQLRRRFLERYGSHLFHAKTLALLYVMLDKSQIPSSMAEQSGIPAVSMTWSELAQHVEHPCKQEFARYYEWKRNLIARAWGSPAPG